MDNQNIDIRRFQTLSHELRKLMQLKVAYCEGAHQAAVVPAHVSSRLILSLQAQN